MGADKIQGGDLNKSFEIETKIGKSHETGHHQHFKSALK